MTAWRPMTEHVFPWPVRNVIILAFDNDFPDDTQVHRCRVGEHGAFFPHDDVVSMHEQGWIPFAWREDDTPARDNEKFPPMWNDYLTRNESSTA